LPLNDIKVGLAIYIVFLGSDTRISIVVEKTHIILQVYDSLTFKCTISGYASIQKIPTIFSAAYLSSYEELS